MPAGSVHPFKSWFTATMIWETSATSDLQGNEEMDLASKTLYRLGLLLLPEKPSRVFEES